jgi:hypothetical protein
VVDIYLLLGQRPVTALSQWESITFSGNTATRRQCFSHQRQEPHPELGVAPLTRLNSLDAECLYGIGEGVDVVMSKLSKSHCQNGFPTGRRAAALAGIYKSLRQSFDQIQRLATTGLSIRPKTQNTNKKACFIILERFAVFTTTGSKLPKQALVF